MNIAIDFYGTVTESPRLYKKIFHDFFNSPHNVYILSAVKDERKLARDVKRCHLEFTKLIPVIYERYYDIPRLKYEAVRGLAIDLLIDDNKQTVAYFKKRGVLTWLS